MQGISLGSRRALSRPLGYGFPVRNTGLLRARDSHFGSIRAAKTCNNFNLRALRHQCRSNSSSSSSLRPDSSSITSAAPKTWISKLPSRIQPYALLTRVDKPIGTLLLFYPCAWAILMGCYAHGLAPIVPLTNIALFGAGALVMRSAGCTINDMWDRDLDKAVDRTKSRPLANGNISRREALVFLGAQLSVGLGILLQLNWYSIFLGASSLVLVVVYPLMKRITYWPQVVLGLAFNWGALLGWSAVSGTVDWSVCLPLYAGGVSWTLVYDTIYAHQDKLDDGPAGIRSTALLFGDQTRSVLRSFSAASMGLVGMAGYMNGQGLPFYVGVGASSIELWRILRETDFESRESCWGGFVRSGRVGWMICLGLTGDYILEEYYLTKEEE